MAASDGPSTTQLRTSLLLRLVVGMLAALILPMALSAAPAGAAPADEELAFFQLGNAARGQAGLAPLTRDPLADQVARSWSAQMAAANRLSHNPNLASHVSSQVTDQWTRLGENVGVGGSAAALHTAFMNSSGHRANILGAYNRVGIGVVQSGSSIWVTVVFIQGPAIAASVPTSNFAPFPNASAFVQQQYVDILGRNADAGGLEFWRARLESGSLGTGDLGANLLLSAEFGGVVAPITRLYFAALHRVPDDSGLRHWLTQVRSGMSIVDVARTFAASAEFTAANGSLDNRQFVSTLYLNVLGRAADAGGLDYWSGLLNTGRLDRGQVLYQFAESGEFVYNTRFGVTVANTYVALLRRSADAGGYNYWVDQFWRGTSPAILVGSFYKTAEYAARF